MSCQGCKASQTQNGKRTNPQMLIQLIQGDLPKPSFLKVKVALPSERVKTLRQIMREKKLSTVCVEAMCPNINECWGGGTATFMLMGDTCTRACKFCNVNHGKPQALDPNEPKHLAEAIAELNLDYVVITCVDRDDLPDGGSEHFAKCIHHLRKVQPSSSGCRVGITRPKLLIEVLTSDFQGKHEDIKKVINAAPDVFAHNIETVERLQRHARDFRASYEQSLGVLRYVKEVAPAMYTKSSIMVGLGEKPDEVMEAMKDLRAIEVDFLTIGQYLRPTAWNLPVTEYVRPEQYKKYEEQGLALGFKYVAAGPYVRSSYKAGELFVKNLHGTH